MTAPATTRGGTRHVYELDARQAFAATCSAGHAVREAGGVRASTVSGARAHVALLELPSGGGRALGAAPAETFIYVLAGRLDADIAGAVVAVPRCSALHVPAAAQFAVRAPVAARLLLTHARVADAAACIAGADWQAAVPALAEPRTVAAGGVPVQHVYAIDALDAVPAGATSARVVPKNFVSGKSSSFGAALSGTALHVGVIHKARGSGAKLHTHPNEQFNVVLKGRLLGEIAGEPMEVTPYGLIHMPAGVQHCTAASGESDLTVFVVKDTSHGLSGPPVDGIEDGPRYLPGFGPNKQA